MAEPIEQQPAQHHDIVDSPFWTAGLLLALFALALVSLLICRKNHADVNSWVKVLGFIATISIFAILYKDNPIFRFAEHLFIGLATGYGLIVSWYTYAEPKWFDPMMPSSVIHVVNPGDVRGQWWFIFAFLIGLLFFTVFVQRWAWMNRFALFIFAFGFFAGAALQSFMGGLGPQLVAMFKATPATVYRPADMPGGVNNFQISHAGPWFHLWWLLAFLVLTCTMTYFVFSIEHKSEWIRKPANAGRYFIMITLGAIFGTTVMARFALAIERLDFLRTAVYGWGHLALQWLHHLK